MFTSVCVTFPVSHPLKQTAGARALTPSSQPSPYLPLAPWSPEPAPLPGRMVQWIERFPDLGTPAPTSASTSFPPGFLQGTPELIPARGAGGVVWASRREGREGARPQRTQDPVWGCRWSLGSQPRAGGYVTQEGTGGESLAVFAGPGPLHTAMGQDLIPAPIPPPLCPLAPPAEHHRL